MKAGIHTICLPQKTRRDFLRAATVCVFGIGSASALTPVSRSAMWIRIRDVVASGAIGNALYASALVPFDATMQEGDSEVSQFGARLPRPVAEVLHDVLFVLSQRSPDHVTIARHEETGAFSMNSVLAGGERISIATLHANAPLSVTFRGTTGAIFLNGNALIIEANGRCRELHH